jgi:hypothetical protein
MATPAASLFARNPAAVLRKTPRSWRKCSVSMVGPTDKPAGLGFEEQIDRPFAGLMAALIRLAVGHG